MPKLMAAPDWTAKQLAQKVATYLVRYPAAQHEDFFMQLDQELRKHALRLMVHQRGVFGSYITIGKVEPPK